MKPLPITTPATKDGIGVPNNPYISPVGDIIDNMAMLNYKRDYPPLLIIDQNNNPVKEGWTGEVTGPHWQFKPFKDNEEWEGGKEWQFEPDDNVQDYTGFDDYTHQVEWGFETRQVYKVSDAPEKGNTQDDFNKVLSTVIDVRYMPKYTSAYLDPNNPFYDEFHNTPAPLSDKSEPLYFDAYDESFKNLHQDIHNLFTKYGEKDVAQAYLTYQKEKVTGNYKLFKSWK